MGIPAGTPRLLCSAGGRPGGDIGPSILSLGHDIFVVDVNALLVSIPLDVGGKCSILDDIRNGAKSHC